MMLTTVLAGLSILGGFPTASESLADQSGANGACDSCYEFYSQSRDPWEDNPDWDYDCDEDMYIIVVSKSKE